MIPSLWRKETELLPMSRLVDRFMQELFDERGWPVARKGNGDQLLVPPIDLRETEEALIVETELPGIDPKNVTVQVNGDLLTIRGERKQEEEKKTRTYYRQECSYGTFERQLTLPVPIDREKVEATFANGMLTVTLPKQAGSKVKSVAVKVKPS